MISIFQFFVRFTAWPAYFFCVRNKVHYEDKKEQSRKIKGSAIIISNHTSVYDFAVMLFTFPFRTLRYLIAEILMNKKNLGRFLRWLGGIKVDRDSFNFDFVGKSLDILDKNGVVGVFPESRIPVEGEERPLPFKPSAAYIAYLSGKPIIPVYTMGSYFNKKRNHTIIGKQIDVNEIIDNNLSEKENIDKINTVLRERIIELGEKLREKLANKKRKKDKKEA